MPRAVTNKRHPQERHVLQLSRLPALHCTSPPLTCVQYEYISHNSFAVFDEHRFAPSYDLDVDHILLGIQLPELKVLLVVVQSTWQQHGVAATQTVLVSVADAECAVLTTGAIGLRMDMFRLK